MGETLFNFSIGFIVVVLVSMVGAMMLDVVFDVKPREVALWFRERCDVFHRKTETEKAVDELNKELDRRAAVLVKERGLSAVTAMADALNQYRAETKAAHDSLNRE